MVHFLFSNNLAATASLIIKESDPLWLGYLRSPVEVAYFRIAFSLAKLVMLPIKSLTNTTYRELNQLFAQRAWAEIRRLLRRATLLAATWGTLAGGAILATSPLLIRLLYGNDLEPVIPALAILLAGKVMANAFFWDRLLVMSLGLSGFLISVSITLIVVKVALTLAVVPQYGYLGNSIVLCVIYALSVALVVRRGRAELAAREELTGGQDDSNGLAEADTDRVSSVQARRALQKGEHLA
jgi:O-antigen/teichoic acid export membrane protein